MTARDQGCIGCRANPLWCRAHHVVWWSKNGTTDLNNLVLVCDGCHRKIHEHNWTDHQNQETRKYCLKPPDP
ncbi:MAG: HNH endonuclease [Acidimicrobiaceae bacterium]|nr:HNH endonuclease [Acidimicrobiaceae bacterium]